MAKKERLLRKHPTDAEGWTTVIKKGKSSGSPERLPVCGFSEGCIRMTEAMWGVGNAVGGGGGKPHPGWWGGPTPSTFQSFLCFGGADF